VKAPNGCRLLTLLLRLNPHLLAVAGQADGAVVVGALLRLFAPTKMMDDGELPGGTAPFERAVAGRGGAISG
jgi:hypothetical protein